MRLANFSKTFGLDELANFNKKENKHYIGPITPSFVLQPKWYESEWKKRLPEMVQ